MPTHHRMRRDGPITAEGRIARALLSLRLSVFLVMLMWALDKLINPEHTAQVFATFYSVRGLGEAAFRVIGLAELILLAAFVLGFRKRVSYGLVLLLHAVSTFSSYRQYLDPFNNLLFFAAWPMLAACFTLYTLRDLDTSVPRLPRLLGR
jgi:putative oxidoreductase